MAYIEFKNVVKEYTMGDNKIRALDNANFEINKGELVVIVGGQEYYDGVRVLGLYQLAQLKTVPVWQVNVQQH